MMMAPVYFNSSPNDYPSYGNEDQINNFHGFLSPNSQTCHLFLNPTVEGENYGSQEYNDEKVSNDSDLKFCLWKSEINNMNGQNQVSSKMRVMLKMKKSHDPNYEMNVFGSSKHEEHKPPMEETDNSSNGDSSNIVPIRVCSDCNTTKTPLWRSGPQGPKSLCNACGIRQRKARRAIAAAAATTTEGENGVIRKPITTPFKVKKTHHKDCKKTSNENVTKHKKRQYTKQITTTPSPSSSSPSSSSPTGKNRVEDFLVNLRNNLPFYQVFPQDEKEAAILLMALSCDYVHE